MNASSTFRVAPASGGLALASRQSLPLRLKRSGATPERTRETRVLPR